MDAVQERFALIEDHPPPPIFCKKHAPNYAIQWGSVWQKKVPLGFLQKTWHTDPKYGMRTPPL